MRHRSGDGRRTSRRPSAPAFSPPTVADVLGGRVPAGQVRSVLGERVLVSFADLSGRLVAIRLDRRRATFLDLGPSDAIRAEVEHLRFALLRMARGSASPGTAASAVASVEALDDVLVKRVDCSDHPIVLVPTRDLFAMPWSVLPSLARRSVVVAPSASMWAQAPPRRRRSGRQVVAAGPGLRNAALEVEVVSVTWPSALTLTGDSASVRGLLAAMEGADVLHIACHGVLRADNPLFSHLVVADGPLAVHDIEGLRRAPTTVVLSACDSALAQPRPGGEWLGLASALLSLGTQSLVASVLPVPDTAITVQIMARLHAGLSAGLAPPEALSAATAAVEDVDPVSLAARGAFVCIGR